MFEGSIRKAILTDQSEKKAIWINQSETTSIEPIRKQKQKNVQTYKWLIKKIFEKHFERINQRVVIHINQSKSAFNEPIM